MKSLKSFIGKVLIQLGVLIITIVVFLNYMTIRSNEVLVYKYTKSVKNEDNKNGYKIGDVIGILNIPKIDLEVAIKKGVKREVLKDAIGHFENTAMPGEYGNCSLAGHRAYINNKFFSNLDELEIEDDIYVFSNNKKFKYKVKSIEVVAPDEVHVINSVDKSKREITLVTCTPKYTGINRLIVKGQYVDVY